MAMEHPPFIGDVFPILKMGIFQLAMLVFGSVSTREKTDAFTTLLHFPQCDFLVGSDPQNKSAQHVDKKLQVGKLLSVF